MTEKKKKLTRNVLLIVGPLVVVIVAGWFYITGGRYISTENAYLKTDIVSIVPEVSGTVQTVGIAENQKVDKGELLFSLDPSTYEIVLQKARAELVSAETQIAVRKARYYQQIEDIAIARADYELAKKTYDRRAALKKQNSSVISPEEMDKAEHDLQSAEKRIALLEQQKAEILAMLSGDPEIATEEHPLYKAALAQEHQAQLNLDRTKIYAPADGIIRHAPHAGDYAQAGLPLTSLAVTGNKWIEANYKETELTSVTPGLPVTITVDTFPDREWKGKVQSIAPATESEFSVLPAQNASGNWVKVVQRIPVRISFEDQNGEVPLRAGMSAHVTIDTGTWPHMPDFIVNH